MTTLHALDLTPAHLTPTAQALLMAIRTNSCAWKVRNGWRPKRPGFKDFKRQTGDFLVSLKLAQILATKGPPRLELTAAGEEMAKVIKAKRSRSAA